MHIMISVAVTKLVVPYSTPLHEVIKHCILLNQLSTSNEMYKVVQNGNRYGR